MLLTSRFFFFYFKQWFSNLSCLHTTAHFQSLPHLIHLIQLIISLVEAANPKMGVYDKRDIQNRLRNTAFKGVAIISEVRGTEMSNVIPFSLTNLLVLRNQIHCWTITKNLVFLKKLILYFPNDSFMVYILQTLFPPFL